MLENAPLAKHVEVILTDLRATAACHTAPHGAVALLHALILAAITRLFTSLENLLTLWQAGQCGPTPPASTQPVPTQPVPTQPAPIQPQIERQARENTTAPRIRPRPGSARPIPSPGPRHVPRTAHSPGTPRATFPPASMAVPGRVRPPPDIFNFSTQYYLQHKQIPSVQDFKLSETEYADFVNYKIR